MCTRIAKIHLMYVIINSLIYLLPVVFITLSFTITFFTFATAFVACCFFYYFSCLHLHQINEINIY